MEPLFEKHIEFIYGDNNSEVLSLIHPKSFVKTAEISSELSEFISSLKERPDVTYALVNALSSGEYFSSNRNGDYFPEKALREYHKTFEALANIYKHHVNKDPNLSMGKVLFSHYNPTMHRVELVLELKNEKAQEVIDKLKKGELPAVSMGARVPFDVCSICGNKAKNRGEYCDHLTKQMNQILPGGKKVYAINTMPKFFDISVVTIPADKTAGFLKMLEAGKIAQNSSEKLASYLNYSYTKEASLNNTAAITKKIVGTVEAMDKEPKVLAEKIEKRLPDHVLTKLSEFSFTDVLSTMAAFGVIPHPADFQKLALYAANKKELADKLDERNQIFEITADVVPDDISNLDISNPSQKIAEVIAPQLAETSFYKPFVIGRLLQKTAQLVETSGSTEIAVPRNYTHQVEEPSFLNKLLFNRKPEPNTSPYKNPILTLLGLGALYTGYQKYIKNPKPGWFAALVNKHDWFLPLLIGGGTATSLWAQKDSFKKTASVGRILANSFVTVPVSYYVAGNAENRAQRGEPISEIENFIRKYPALSAIAASFGASKIYDIAKSTKKEIALTKNLTKTASLLWDIPEPVLDEIYIDLLKIYGEN